MAQNPNPGWALDRIGENIPDGASYTYPITSNPVRLYLIDTAVANPASWEAANPNLIFEGTEQLFGSESVNFKHGTQLVSLIAGGQTGVSPGTPIHVKNYDIYPDAPSNPNEEPQSDLTLLAQAIPRAVQHSKHEDTDKMRSVILIASSLKIPPNSPSSYGASVKTAIQAAIAQGIPVIIGAGNDGEDADGHIPAKFADDFDGVICVGASNASDTRWTNSNFGAPVDLLAPGVDVWSRAESATSPVVNLTGTSASVALVAGCVLTELSINGSLTPAEMEARIKSSAKPNTVAGQPGILRTTPAFSIAIANPDGPIILPEAPQMLAAEESLESPPAGGEEPGGPGGGLGLVDEDSDGIPDVVELFHQGHSSGVPAAASLKPIANGQVEFRFPVAFDQFRSSNPFVLNAGHTWKIRCTTDFKNWQVPEGSLTKSTDARGQVWLTATFPAGQTACFVRIEIEPAAP